MRPLDKRESKWYNGGRAFFERAADNRAAAKFPLYHTSSTFVKQNLQKIAQIFIPKFVQNCYLFFIKNNAIINYKIKEGKTVGAENNSKKS